MNYNS